MNPAPLICAFMVIIIFHDEIPFFNLGDMKSLITTRSEKRPTNYLNLLTGWNSLLLLSGFIINYFNISILFKDSIHSYWGNFLMLVGLFIKITASKTFTAFIGMDKNQSGHKLIDLGMYRVLRHPGYLGMILLWIGASISSNNIVVFVLVTITTIIEFYYRMISEEKTMIHDFGDEYKNYMKKTKRLIPLIY